MQMTDREILDSYNHAKKPNVQISIIADLNLCSKDDVMDVLEKQGIVFAGRKKKSGDTKLDTLVYGKLVIMSAKSSDYRKNLEIATDDQLREAVKIMQDRHGRDKLRIVECKKELRRRLHRDS